MHHATFTLSCDDPATAKVLVDAVGIEAEDGPAGTTTTLSLQGTQVVGELDAEDLSGLRAALHGVIRLLDAAQRTATA